LQAVSTELPVIDVIDLDDLVRATPARAEVARRIGEAFRATISRRAAPPTR
jgi:hypothetical protein